MIHRFKDKGMASLNPQWAGSPRQRLATRSSSSRQATEFVNTNPSDVPWLLLRSATTPCAVWSTSRKSASKCWPPGQSLTLRVSAVHNGSTCLVTQLASSDAKYRDCWWMSWVPQPPRTEHPLLDASSIHLCSRPGPPTGPRHTVHRHAELVDLHRKMTRKPIAPAFAPRRWTHPRLARRIAGLGRDVIILPQPRSHIPSTTARTQ